MCQRVYDDATVICVHKSWQPGDQVPFLCINTLRLHVNDWAWSLYYPIWYLNKMLLCSTDVYTLHWRHNGRDSVSNHQPHDCVLNHLFRRKSKKTSKLRVRLRLRQCLFNQNRYRYHIRFTKNITIYNNHILLIYNESNACWETSIKVISDRWHGGHPNRNSMHTQWENT